MNATDNVDLYSGAVELSVELINLPGRNGLDLNLTIQYSSRLYDAATRWNLTEPTGVLGLGWTLPYQGILAVYDSNVSDVAYYLVSGPDSGPLICTGSDAQGRQLFALENYRFWEITYDPANRLWRLIHEDGSTWIYGDQNNSRGTIQWGICWGNWRGASTEQNEQTPVPLAFNLSQITNRFGDAITWEYDNVLQQVGPHTSTFTAAVYTQATYLKKITGVTGESVVLSYLEKIDDLNTQEYVVAHTAPSSPNAYQDRYQTRYLDSLTAYAADGSAMFTQQFKYVSPDGQTALLGTGDMAKRLLTEIVQIPAGYDKYLPGARFTYCGQDSVDAVSASAPFNATTHCLYGAVKTLTTEGGGTISYQYGAVSPALSSRTVTVEPPTVANVTFSQPRFHFADAYAVATWLGSDNNMYVVIYSWDDRWVAPSQQQGLDSLPVADAAAYAAVPVVCDTGICAAFSQNQMHLYQADTTRAGMWILPAVSQGSTTVKYFTTDFAAGEGVALVAGQNFAAALGLTGGHLFRYRTTANGWQADAPVTLSAGAGANAYAATARDNYLLALYTLEAAGANPLYANLYVLDETGVWQSSTFNLERHLAQVDAVLLVAGDAFAIATLTDTDASSTDVEYVALWWSADGQSLASQSLGVFNVPADQVVAPAVNGNAVAIGQMLYRFDGVKWNYQNIGGGTLESIAYGTDLVLRTLAAAGSQYIYDLTQYDPNTGSWASALSATEGAASNFNIAARGRPGLSPYAVLDSKLYNRLPDGTWRLTTATIPPLSGDDAKSPALAGDRFLLYQQAGNTYVYPLQDGAPLPSILLTGCQIYTQTTNLIGATAFVGYTGTYGAVGSTLTLYRVHDFAVTGLTDCYVVAARLANNGYQTVTTGYVYNPDKAISAAGRVLRSNQTTTIAGCADPLARPNGWLDSYYFTGLTPDETPALPYPVDLNYTNAPTYYSLAAGSLYNIRAFPAGAGPTGFVSEDVNFVWAYAQTLGQLATGYYLRTLKCASTVDGVTSATTSAFSPDTGLVIQSVASNFNSSGQAEQIISEYKYFNEAYGQQSLLHLLTPIIQTKMSTVVGQTSTTTGIYVTTYRDDWGTGTQQWAPDRTYRALSGSAPPFNNWQPQQGDPPAGWLRTSTILALTSTGLPRRTANVVGALCAIVCDKDRLMSVASFVNADPDNGEASYYGFDPYEQPNGWGWSEIGHSLQDYITRTDYHTGVQCLMLPAAPGRQAGPVRKFQPGGQHRIYYFGLWVKTQPNFAPEQGAAAFEIEVYQADSPQTKIATLSLPITDTQNQWVYKQQTINLPQLRAAAHLPPSTQLYLRISGWNQNSNNYVLADNLRFSPVDATFAATVYDPQKRLVTATLGNNGETFRTVYDMYDRAVVHIGPTERVNMLSAESYSRALTPGDVFLPQFPNTALQLGTTSKSLYYDFHDNTTGQWTFNGAGGTWTIAGGRLNYTGTATDPLGATAVLNIVAFTNFALRVVCPTHQGSAGVGNGDAFVYWDNANSVWKLVRRQTSGPPTLIASSTAAGFHPDMLYVIIDGLLLFYAGGVMIFAYDYQNPNMSLPDLGKPALLLTQTGSFDDLVALNDPQLSVSFQDGFMGSLQSVSLLGYTAGTTYAVQGQGVFLDMLGRAYINRKPAQPALAISAPSIQLSADTGRELIAGDQTTYLVNSAGQSVSYQDYINGTYGYDYTEYQFEPSPLSRVKSATLPREKDQSASKFTITYEYGAATAEVIQGILPAGTEGNYLLLTTTDQDGAQCYRIFDQTGKLIAARVRTGAGAFLTAAVVYDACGHAATFKQPNYFTPPPNSQADTWVETCTYTFNGLVASRTTPDAGQTAYLYDNADRLRFVAPADGTALTPPQFVYMKYDTLGRCVEEGYIQDANVTWAGLASVVNDQTYPNLNLISGAWLKQRIYDVDSQGSALNLLGRLWCVAINNQNSQTPDTESFTYDSAGNISSTTTLAPTIDPAAYTSGYSYDNQNNITVVTYPHKDGETPFQIANYYDRLGRTAAVGKPVDPWVVIDPANPATGNEDLFAAYTYAGTGALSHERLNNHTDGTTNYTFNRTYTYDEPGWLTQIDDPYFRQNIAYYELPGYNGTTYYSGIISQTSYIYKPGPGFQPPLNYGYSYAYDPWKRLITAANTLTDAGTISVGAQGYDANSNLRRLGRGVTTEAYSYQESASSQQQQTDRVYNVTESVTAAINFSADVTGWSWGASNGGPTTSALITHDGGHALQLGGGGLGHFEFLQLNSYLAPDGIYNLSYLLMTPPGFADGTGDAAWYLTIFTAAGAAINVPIAAIPDTGGSWQQQNITNVNVGTLLASLAPDAVPVAALLQLRNYRRPRSGPASGGSFAVTNINLATAAPVVGGVYTYRPGGAVLAAPAREITQISYDPVNSLPRQIQMNNKPSLLFGYDGSDARLSVIAGTVKSLYLRAPDATPLRIVTSDGTPTTSYNIYGVKGLLCVQQPAGLFFVLKDNLGSTRLLVNDADQLVGGLDYLPFGERMRTYGTVNTDYLFTGQELDKQTDLYNYSARLYDPSLRRFYAPDWAGPSPSPYVYCGNNPVCMVDPDGNYLDWVSDYVEQLANYAYANSGMIVAGVATTAAIVAGTVRFRPVIVASAMAAAGGISTAVAASYHSVVNGAVALGGAGVAAWTAVTPYAVTGVTWLYHHPRYTLQLALMGYNLLTSSSLSVFVGNAALDIAVSVISANTALRILHVVDANIPLRFAPFVWALGAAELGIEGAFKGQLRRGFRYVSSYVFGDEATRSEIAFLQWEDYKIDAFYNILSHALFNNLDFRTAISPRASYPHGKIYVAYLKFPTAFNQWRRWNFWRGFIIPYKGIASGHGSPMAVAHSRHNNHHWNAYGFGPHFVIAASTNGNAIKYLERWVIQYFGPAAHITGHAGLQQAWPLGVGQGPAMRPHFLEEFVYWHFRYAFTHLNTPVEAATNVTVTFINGVADLWQGR